MLQLLFQGQMAACGVGLSQREPRVGNQSCRQLHVGISLSRDGRKCTRLPGAAGVGSQQIQQRQSRLPSCRDGLCAPGWSERGKSDGKRSEVMAETQSREWDRAAESGTELQMVE